MNPNSFTVKSDDWVLCLWIDVSSREVGKRLKHFVKQMKSLAFIESLKKDGGKLRSILKKIETEGEEK